MIYLDTHVVVWAYLGDKSRFSKHSLLLLEENDLTISPMVQLELQYLHEIGRLQAGASDIIDSLSASINLQVAKVPFSLVVAEAITLDWIRDPFDRMIVATAIADKSRLVTKDRTILQHFSDAVWD